MKRINFGFGKQVAGGSSGTKSVYPGQILTDVLVFERPVDLAKTVELRLPGDNIGSNVNAVGTLPITAEKKGYNLADLAKKTK